MEWLICKVIKVNKLDGCGHPIYFVWHNIAPFCFLITQIRPNITALHFHLQLYYNRVFASACV
jgi:hypothetical protein